MKTYCRAQGTFLSALWGPKRERNPKRKGIYLSIQLIHFAAQQKLMQHSKATILQFKKKKKKG